ncbi:hypothetical protein PRZ48_012626 [Zasmidium cellare]|uniref:Uncharacterized protein n=1 Tax=Zasmidium cellare TaxID=395010 RepID=A0ABR0E5E9_ZASCE|nr:hypothetical protein PRZ48_012626 [Zasmidium cellare]
MSKFSSLYALSALCCLTQANPLQPRAAATPTLKSATEVGYVASYPTLNRDSMVGTKVGNRYFWISRDATTFDGQCCFIIASAASWTNLNSDGSPFLTNGANQTTYGDNNYTSYFRTPYGQFPPNGFGDNFERYINWPDTPPLPVSDPTNNRIKLYTWTRNVHQLNDTTNAPGNPQTILYRSDYYSNSDSNTLPPVTVVGYGWVISPTDGFAYLYPFLRRRGSAP